MSESPRTRRVRISSIEMPATPSLPGGGAPNKSSAIRSASSVKTASLSSPPSSAKRVSYKKNMKADPTESRRQYHMNKLRKITASPVFMNSPGGPSLSPRKLYIPSIRNMKNANTDPSTSILPNFNDSMTISLAAPNHKESNNSNRFTSSIVSPGTRQYLVSSFQDHAEQVNPLDNGDQYLLRALLLENTTIDENQLKNVSLYYEKSIAIRDGDDKIAMRLYNYASFTFWDNKNKGQGWISHDPISNSGPALCVGIDSIQNVFPTKEEDESSRSVAKDEEQKLKEDGTNPNVICRFECQMDENS
jgi:hypothetical protein